ncbi:MAG: hypothetical protein Q9220_007761 [cf. Caloplaca sp. 1 TL-2023]
MTFMVEIAPPTAVGSLSRGTPLNAVPMTGGTLTSEPAFSEKIKAKFATQGNDYIRADPDGRGMRLDAHAVLLDEESKGHIYAHYTGIIAITEGVSKILGGGEDAKTTEFGDAFIHITFETGTPALRELELGVFVGAGRFLVEKDKPVTVEYRISKVVI